MLYRKQLHSLHFLFKANIVNDASGRQIQSEQLFLGGERRKSFDLLKAPLYDFGSFDEGFIPKDLPTSPQSSRPKASFTI